VRDLFTESVWAAPTTPRHDAQCGSHLASRKGSGAVSWLIDNALRLTCTPGEHHLGATTAYLLNSSTTLAGTGAQRGEALQFAIWDMTVDGADGFSSGRVAQAPDKPILWCWPPPSSTRVPPRPMDGRCVRLHQLVGEPLADRWHARPDVGKDRCFRQRPEAHRSRAGHSHPGGWGADRHRLGWRRRSGSIPKPTPELSFRVLTKS